MTAYNILEATEYRGYEDGDTVLNQAVIEYAETAEYVATLGTMEALISMNVEQVEAAAAKALNIDPSTVTAYPFGANINGDPSQRNLYVTADAWTISTGTTLWKIFRPSTRRYTVTVGKNTIQVQQPHWFDLPLNLTDLQAPDLIDFEGKHPDDLDAGQSTVMVFDGGPRFNRTTMRARIERTA